MEVWTAVVMAEGGQYHGTMAAVSESALIEMVRENFDPEGEFEGEFDWASFEEFFQFDIRVDSHLIEET